MGQRKIATLVGVVMGSESDWDIMRHAAMQLDAFGIAYEARVLSAHRMPDDMLEYAEDAGPRGLRCIIAGAGGAAHLPGMLASKTAVPVLGVPVPLFGFPFVCLLWVVWLVLSRPASRMVQLAGVLGVIVGGIVISMYLPIFDLISKLT